MPPQFALLALAAAGDAAKLQRDLDDAIAAGAPAFTVPPGEYNFSTTNFEVRGARRLRLQAAGVQLWFQNTTGLNVSNSADLHIAGPLLINYTAMRRANRGRPGITFNLLNCSDVVSEDVTIVQAPDMAVTAFNGGGGHVFRRFVLPAGMWEPPDHRNAYQHQRDAFHFTDLRRGVLLEDSVARSLGDDFFNAHNTLMVVLRVETPSQLLVVNPHLEGYWNGGRGKNTVYGTNCVLENLRPGDAASFFAWPENTSTVATPEALGAGLVDAAPTAIGDSAAVAEAAALFKGISRNRSTAGMESDDIWRVRFARAVPSRVGPGTLVNLDSFATPGTVVRNNVFANSRYHMGRFKSTGGSIVNNTFMPPYMAQLEVAPLLSFFEGNLPVARDVLVADNVVGYAGAEPADPFYCAPMAIRPQVNCSGGDTPFAVNVTVRGNSFRRVG